MYIGINVIEMDENGWKWIKIDENVMQMWWQLMEVDRNVMESGWNLMEIDEN